MMPKRDWTEMAWPEVAAGDTKRWIAVLPVAAVEQHGPHLPLGVDYYIAQAYIARVLPLLPADLPATFLPIQQIGQSDEHRAFPGTLSFSAHTIIGAYTEIGESIHRCGVRKLVIVTSHGGNVAAMDLVARDLRVRLKMLAVTCAWHRFGYPSGTFERMELRHGVHAGDVETSLLLAHRPETVDIARARAKGRAGACPWGEGVCGIAARCRPLRSQAAGRWPRLKDVISPRRPSMSPPPYPPPHAGEGREGVPLRQTRICCSPIKCVRAGDESPVFPVPQWVKGSTGETAADTTRTNDV